MEHKITLNLTLVDRIYSKGKSRRILEVIPTLNTASFSGNTKYECLKQAKDNFKTGVEWQQEWTFKKN